MCVCGMKDGENADDCERCQLIALLKLVESMRAAQRAYFRNRDGQSLQDSKTLERQVDQGLEALFRKQKDLF